MTRFRFLTESIVYHWRTNLAVLLGCVVGASVLTGALLVGDSMRGSLREMTLERLGRIDQVVVGTRFFEQSLPERIAKQQGFSEQFADPAAVILIQGSVSLNDKVITGVNLIGTTPAFWKLFPLPPGAESAEEFAKRSIANEELASQLGAKVKDRIIARLENASPIPKEGLLGERDQESIRTLPVVLDEVIASAGVGRFGLDATQRLPKNLYLPIEKLAETIEQPGRANALFLSATTSESSTSTEAADQMLAKSLTLSDYGVTLRPSDKFGYLAVESRRQILDNTIGDATSSAAKALGVAELPVLTYLANSIKVGERQVPYSIVTAVDTNAKPPLGPLPTQPADVTLKKDEILLNQWAVGELKAKVGDQVTLEYYIVAKDGSLATQSSNFRLAGVVEMKGLALDRDFTPEYPGISDADNFADWDPPFPVDLDRVRKVDEKYWDDYRTTPKAFVRLEDGQRLWTTRFGNLTSVRVAPASRTTPTQFAPAFADKLLTELKPSDLGFAFLAIKSQDLLASSGSTDFGQLFLAFSFFLIASAALLVGLLFRLNIERRASQVGLLLAVGLTSKTVRRFLLLEGLLLASVGSLVGLAGAVLYAKLMIAALTSWWQAAVNTPFIEFHATPLSFIIGWTSSVVVAMLAIWWAVARLGKSSPIRLMSQGFTFASDPTGRGLMWSWVVGVVGLMGGVGSLLASPAIGQVGAFFGGGALLLIGALGFASVLLRGSGGSMTRGSGLLALAKLGIRNGGRYPARSIVTISLIAFATFVIVSVGVMRHGEHDEGPSKDSGNGGFSLVAESSLPIFRNLADPDARFDLGLSAEADKLLEQSSIQQFRVRSGDDASCLNIYQPRDPTLLGVPEAFIERGGFAFASSLAETEAERANPWLLLNKDLGPDEVPAIGDMNTLMWILKVGVGKTLSIRNEAGRELKLRIVGSLAGSVFQGELLIGERAFLQQFPNQTGYKYFLFETPEGDAGKLSSLLAKDLADYGFNVEGTGERIAAFKAVENTYMATFQTLGGLGLLLGTLGLGTVLLRNVLERRGELGLLRALGFRNVSLGWLVLAENLFLLFAGLGIGAGAAVVAVIPQLQQMTELSSLGSLAGVLLLVVVAGTLSGVFAVMAALRSPLITALRAE